MIFIDTSAILALVNRRDRYHPTAMELFNRAGEEAEPLLTHNYVLLEAFALIHRRLGLSVALQWANASAFFQVEWVSRELHEEAIDKLGKSRNQRISLVDQISFLVMRRRGVTTAFAFDEDFSDQGFTLYR